MDWEKIATSAIVAEISKTDTLSGFISEGDKEPCWDGNIYIHEDSNHTKTNLKRIPTQVKGKAVKSKKIKETITYRISYDDLNAYMMDGGTLFFVVYIDKEHGNVLQIYYTTLLPIRIMNIFKHKQKTYSVSFDRFPTDNKKKKEIVLNAYADAQRQKSFAGKKLPTIDDLKNKGVLESVSFHFTTIENEISTRTVPQIIEGKSLTIYANIKGNPIGIPVEYHHNVTQVKTCQYIKKSISVNGIVFFDRYKVMYSFSNAEISIGKCLSIVLPIIPNEENEGLPATVKINVKGSLKEQIKGFRFVLAIAKNDGFEMGLNHFPIHLMNGKNDETINKFGEQLNILETIQIVLDCMHVSKDLLIEECNAQDENNIRLLIGALGEKRPVENIPERINEVQTLKICNLSLGVVYVKHTDGYYYIHDYFGDHLEVLWKNEKEVMMRISQYATMTAEDFLKYDNLNLSIIIEDFKMLPISSDIVNQANLLMLEMIKAFDQSKDIALLEKSNEMNEWISGYPEWIDCPIFIINRYQIIARQRGLQLSEKVELLSIEEKSDNKYYKAAVWILLGESEKANSILASFDECELDEFCSFPIYTLHKHNAT